MKQITQTFLEGESLTLNKGAGKQPGSLLKICIIPWMFLTHFAIANRLPVFFVREILVAVGFINQRVCFRVRNVLHRATFFP